MIWADRIGIGLTALTAIALTIGYFYSSSEATERIERQKSEYAKTMELCDQLKRDKLDLLQQLMLEQCQEAKAPTITIEMPTIADAESRFIGLFLYLLLPFWLVLRVIDFMFGGPTRRHAPPSKGTIF